MQPGIVLDTLRNPAETHQLTFAPDPSTHNRCTIGGMIGNNSCGTHSLLGGKTVDNVEELRILLYDGTQMTVGRHERLRPRIASFAKVAGAAKSTASCARFATVRRSDPRAISRAFPGAFPVTTSMNCFPRTSFHVARALVGTEGTCAIVLEAKLQADS